MKLPSGYGSVVKLSDKRGRPYQVKKATDWHYDKEKGKQVQDMITIGYEIKNRHSSTPQYRQTA